MRRGLFAIGNLDLLPIVLAVLLVPDGANGQLADKEQAPRGVFTDFQLHPGLGARAPAAIPYTGVLISPHQAADLGVEITWLNKQWNQLWLRKPLAA